MRRGPSRSMSIFSVMMTLLKPVIPCLVLNFPTCFLTFISDEHCADALVGQVDVSFDEKSWSAVADLRGRGVADIGCTKNVAGQDWLDSMFERLSELGLRALKDLTTRRSTVSEALLVSRPVPTGCPSGSLDAIRRSASVRYQASCLC